jgi:hypothetical protein
MRVDGLGCVMMTTAPPGDRDGKLAERLLRCRDQRPEGAWHALAWHKL